MYEASYDEKQKRQFDELYGNIMMAMSLCQCGHIDNFCLSEIVKHRDGIRGVLSKDDADTFDAYLEKNDMKTAFGNSDFRKIYRKIVGDSERSGKVQDWMRSEED